MRCIKRAVQIIALVVALVFGGTVAGLATGVLTPAAIVEAIATFVSTSTVATLPSTPIIGSIRYVTDLLAANDCAVGGGSVRAICIFDGSSYVPISGVAVEADTLNTVFDRGKIIDGANSLANAVRIGDVTTPTCLYTDATLGPQVRPCTDADVKTIIPANFTWCLWDIEAAACVETINPYAATTLAMYTYGAAYRPKKSVWFGAGALSTDGTQCAPAAEVTINSGPKLWTIICADNNGSTIYGSIKMPDNWDAGTVRFAHVYIQTAADTGALNGDIAAQCRGNGEVPSSTWGSEVAIDDAVVGGSNSNGMTTSAAATPAGTCAAGDMLYFRYQLDATGTTTAVTTLHTVGFYMYYTETSRSQ